MLTILDPTLRSPEALDFERGVSRRVVGQERAVKHLTRVYQPYLAGLSPPGRPLANVLLLGPTGSGKTRLVEAAAETLFGNDRAVLKIDCAEYHHSHEISKLIGSPPGYLGHRETHPLITQEALEQHYTENTKLSLVLFDEIEKASDALWQLLLGIMDKATLTLGDNQRVDFSKSMIFLTSNLGSDEITKLAKGGLGFVSDKHSSTDDQIDHKIYRTATDAARKKFSPEFMNRLDKLIVFRALKPHHMEKILDLELDRVQERIMSSGTAQFIFKCTAAARDHLLCEGFSEQYGARELKRVIERLVVFPLSNLVATRQASLGDYVFIDHTPGSNKLTFTKDPAAVLVRSRTPTSVPALAASYS